MKQEAVIVPGGGTTSTFSKGAAGEKGCGRFFCGQKDDMLLVWREMPSEARGEEKISGAILGGGGNEVGLFSLREIEGCSLVTYFTTAKQ